VVGQVAADEVVLVDLRAMSVQQERKNKRKGAG
jgi:hypothetical protein